MEDAAIIRGADYTLPECGFTAQEGMEFAGWMVGEEVKQPGDSIPVTEDVTAAAQWQEPAVPVAVTLEVMNGAWNDGTREPKTIVLTGSAEDELRLEVDDLPEVGHSPDEGYEMGAWEVEPPVHSEELEITTGDPITEDTTYTYIYAPKAAEEEAPAVPVTITFDANGGTGEMEAVSGMTGAYSLPECGFIAPEGNAFMDWAFNGEILSAGETVTLAGDAMLIALWQPAEEAPADAPEAAEPAAEEAGATGEAEAQDQAEAPDGAEAEGEGTTESAEMPEAPAEAEGGDEAPVEGADEAPTEEPAEEYDTQEEALEVDFDEAEAEDATEIEADDAVMAEEPEAEAEAEEAAVQEAEAVPDDELEVSEEAAAIEEEPAEAAMDEPSEVGSVFNGAGVAAIIAAVVLVIAAAGIAATRKKKK